MAFKKVSVEVPAEKETIDSDTDIVGSVDTSKSEEPVKRRRGRPKGSSNKTADGKPSKSASRKESDTQAFAQQLMGIHTMIAMVTGYGELQISDVESVMLAKGFTAVADEYGLSLDGKTGAAIQLLGAVSLIYIPRALAIQSRFAKEKTTDTVFENGSDTPAN